MNKPNWIFLSASSTGELAAKVSALDLNGELKAHYSLHSTSVTSQGPNLLTFFATLERD